MAILENQKDKAQAAVFETLIEGLLTAGYGMSAALLEPELLQGLRANLLHYRETAAMQPAGVGRVFSYEKNAEIRGDAIRWINADSTDPFEQEFQQRIDAFVQYLNRTCYTGIRDYEFHYAYYEAGSFYKRHIDQFKSHQGRKFSLVTYLNTDWEVHEGELLLYPAEKVVSILPEWGRSVFLRSDELEHEVRPAQRLRMSIAGWLKG